MRVKSKSVLAHFRTHLAARLTLVFVSMALLPMLAGAVLSYERARTSLVDLALSKVEQEAGLTAKDLGTFLEQFSSDLLMLSNAPPVQGLLRAQDNLSVDPATGRSYAEWIDWLRQLFVTTARSKHFYQQLRYLDQTGREIVRIDYRDDSVIVVERESDFGVMKLWLDNRASAVYFTAAKRLRTGEIAISAVTLNTEKGAEYPSVPIIYFSTSIYDQAGTFRGVVVSTVYATSFLNRLNVNSGQVYLADQIGSYLVHPDPTRTFATNRVAGYNAAVDFSTLYESLARSNLRSKIALDDRRAEVVALYKLHFDSLHPERYWLLIRTLPEDEVLGPVKNLGIMTAGAALLVMLYVALLTQRLARGFIKPIIRLTQVADQISEKELPHLVESLGRVAAGETTVRYDLKVEPVDVRTEDEVGKLGFAFNKMAASLHEAQVRLLKTQEQLRLQKDAAEQANQAKSIFLANMSHELRTPLNAILGYAHILQQLSLPNDVINRLNIIRQSGEHLLTLINDILDLSKVEAGKMDLHPSPLHLPRFLEQIAGIIRARAERKGLSFRYQAAEDLPTWIEADETRLRQVLLNLLGNAVKFTETGEVVLSVAGAEYRVPSAEESPVTLRFSVRDAGPGIPPDQLERLFKPFEQVGEIAHHVEGSGLGLSISRQLVQLMGSDLHVESDGVPGKGSRFWFAIALPVTVSAMLPHPTPSSDRVITGYSGPRRRILIADDIFSNRVVLVDLLEPLGFDLVEAANGKEAIELAEARRPDLILMDRRMPGLNGFEAAQEIRLHPEFRAVPIIAMSASVSATDQTVSQKMGFDAFLSKPIDWLELASLLETYLNLKWIFKETSEPGLATTSTESELIPPPPDEIEILYDLGMRGDLQGIRERASALEKLDPRFKPFADKLHQLAIDFEDEAILTLVQRYRNAPLPDKQEEP